MAVTPARALAALVLLLPIAARAQPPDAGVDAPAAPPATFDPPRATSPTTVPYPANAPAHDAPIVVTIKLTVGETGAVTAVELVTPPQPPFDDAVIAAARAFQFEPGRHGGVPVAVEITFTHTFLPPPPPPPPTPPEAGPPRESILRGRLIELGTRAPVATATVTARIGDRTYTADTDPRGRFELPLPAGPVQVTVTAPGHNVFVQRESLQPKQALSVTYLVERDRYDPYEIVVVGDQRREEVSRTTLRGPELRQIPGTFGDPFRVVQALPGVASMMSLLPYPVVRGATPSSTGFLIDTTRVPLLYHYLIGTSVVHPEFIDEIQFYPGGSPAPYGGYTGGIVDGRTRRARRDEHLIDADLSLLQTGGLVRQPIGVLGATATLAGRYGYPGLLISLASDDLSVSFWDYQARLDGGTPRNGWTVFGFGASDTISTRPDDPDPTDDMVPPLEPSLILSFHRVDLRAHHTRGKLFASYRTVLGVDRTHSNGASFSLLTAEPAAVLRYTHDERLVAVAGAEGTLRDIRQQTPADPDDEISRRLTADLERFFSAAAWLEALWRPTPRWLVRPGVRSELWADAATTRGAVDPRLTVRYQVARRDLPDVPPDSDDSAIWLKGSAGIYHQPPRFFVPLPGLDLMPLRFGLLRSFQTSLGAEVPLGGRFELSTEAFFNYMDPTIFDLEVNPESIITDPNDTITPTDDPPDDEDEVLDRIIGKRRGRAYGLELLVRRQARSGLFGWVSYTLSRSERLRDGAYRAYDFDRTHLINVVAGLPLRRNWDIGLRLQYQSGKPVTTTGGYNTERTDGYVRFDLRVDKRVVWRRWLLDFYVDITNVALLPEEVSAGEVIRYVLPTVGLRGRF